MRDYYYDYEQRRRRRRQYRARQRRRRRRQLLLALLVLLVGSLVLCLCMCGREKPPEEEPAGNTGIPGAAADPGTAADPGAAEPAKDPKDDWSLILVNRDNPLPAGYTVELASLPSGLEVDRRCYADLTAMLDALYGQGLNPVVCSAYRSVELQQTLYDDMVSTYLQRGYSAAEAKELAGREVLLPGTSEHHLGLAVDIVDLEYQLLDEHQEETAVQQWLLENSWRYGFILRYPTDKTEVTGIIYEPWHYRYVGRERAGEIHASGLCLEEWLAAP